MNLFLFCFSGLTPPVFQPERSPVSASGYGVLIVAKLNDNSIVCHINDHSVESAGCQHAVTDCDACHQFRIFFFSFCCGLIAMKYMKAKIKTIYPIQNAGLLVISVAPPFLIPCLYSSLSRPPTFSLCTRRSSGSR